MADSCGSLTFLDNSEILEEPKVTKRDQAKGQFSEGDPFGSLFLLDPFGSRKSLASLWVFPNQLPEPLEIFSTPLKT